MFSYHSISGVVELVDNAEIARFRRVKQKIAQCIVDVPTRTHNVSLKVGRALLVDRSLAISQFPARDFVIS
jgi:hypothetical protein